MSTDRRSLDSSTRGRTILAELQSLLGSLLGLYSQVSSRLLDSRMSTKRESGTPREGIPIEDLLDSHIEQTAAAVAKTDRAIDAEGHVDGQSAPGSRPKTAPIKTGAKRSGSGLFDALSQYFHQHQSSTHSEPLVREQMRSRTLDHINKALVLARQGDAEGAKVHAGLAETAMRTAGDYMSDEEYSQFREQVETRLRAARTPR